ncbi:MAG: hypothetical protein ACP5XB_28305 [Isosphaeraceae bacterium]
MSSSFLGTDSLVISPAPDSLLLDPSGSTIAFGITNGSTSVIPEPWVLTQGATAAVIGIGLVWRRRGRQAA